MKQPWIHKSKTDTVFILAPSFLVLGVVLLFQDWLQEIQERYSFYTWLFIIVFIDVAHVYATLFKTYFVPNEFYKRRNLYVGLPLFCFVAGVLLFCCGSQVFWSVLAYVAVFHFIRQQYGFMRLYSRNESKAFAWIDNLVIYTATVYPMIFWFLSPKREFNWFVENEFIRYENQNLITLLTYLYFAIMLVYLIRTGVNLITKKYFNLPKNAIIIGTALSWYFGIVYFNNDLAFTLLNVISHGIPYMALIYLNEISKKSPDESSFVFKFKARKGILIFVLFLVLLAFSEEFLWEILVWNEQFSIEEFDFSNWQFILVPLLTVPQFTHYLLDGFIWKKGHNNLS